MKITILTLVIACLAAATATAQIYVDTDATGANDGTSWTNAFTDLQDGLAAATSGDEVWVAEGTYYPSPGTYRGASFDMKTGVAVYGGFAGTETSLIERDFAFNVTVLSGDLGVPGDSLDNSFHVVTANGVLATSILDGFTVTAGYANTPDERGGGGILVQWGSPRFQNLIVEYNYAGSIIGNTTYPGLGGGMRNLYGNPTLENVTFRGNVAHTNSGQGGGIRSSDGDLRLTNVTFIGNEAHDGGGVYSFSGVVDVDHCSFEANVAPGGPGLYVIDSSPTSSHINNTTFVDNDGYGALYAGSPGHLIITGSSFTNTTGAGIKANGNVTFEVDSCVFDGNMWGGIQALTLGTVIASNSSFVGNSTPISGGAIGAQTVTIDNCEFVGNRADSYGGAVYAGNSADISNSSFTANNVGTKGGAVSMRGTVTNSTFDGNWSNSRGGAIDGYDDTLTLTNVVCANNSAPLGGAVSVFGLTSTPCAATIINSTFAGNSADDASSGIYVHTGDTLLLFNSILWGNGHPDSAQIVNNGTSTISHSLVENSGGSGPGWDTGIGADAGGNLGGDPVFAGPPAEPLRLSWSSPCVNAGDNSAPGLPATDLAGDPRIADGIVDMGAYEFVCPPGPVVYVDADATGSGDGTSWANASTQLRLEGPLGCGGITEVWVAEGTYAVGSPDRRSSDLQLVDGLALYGGFDGTETARIHRKPGLNPTVITGDNGTVNCYHVVTGTGTDATAIFDGFFVEGGIADGVNPDDRGAGMINYPGSPTVANVVFRDNQAAAGGGGVYNYLFSAPTFTNVVFDGNNSATTFGGAMYNLLADVTITNATFTGNSAFDAGGAVFNNNGTITLVNSIAWGNFPANDQWYNLSTSPDVSHSLIEGCGGSGGGWNAPFGIDGGGNKDEDPLFVDALAGDLRLHHDSPAVDAGDETAPNLPLADLDGQTRIFGITVDMGAYEYWSYAVGADDTPPPADTGLRAPYPNPFNPTVTIAYEVSASERVVLAIYDVAGRLVRTLVDGARVAGIHHETWDGVDRSGNPAASGVYLVVLEAGARTDYRKITLLK